MKKIHILAPALAIGLISSNLLMPIAYAEGVVDSAEVTEVEEETTEEVEESEEEVVEEDDEEVEEEAEEAEGEERGEARDDGAMSDIERKPINLPRCEALFAELDGMTLKYGSSTYEYTVVDYMVDKYVLSDYTCRGEIADAYGSDVYVSSHDGYVLMHGESKFNDEGAIYRCNYIRICSD